VRRTSDFVAWLLRQQDRDDPVGDFARDMQRDSSFPLMADVDDVRDYVYSLRRDAPVPFSEAVAEYRTGEYRTWDKLNALMDEHPTLNHFGIGHCSALYSPNASPEWNDRILQGHREHLRVSIADVIWTVGWLRSNVEPIKTINRRHSSYGLKHLAELFRPTDYICYLSNGVFIAAAMIVGYPFKLDPPNAMFGMSERSLKRLHRAAARLP
jgi:uncharacterized protein YozE (UPF0346 family)